MFVSVFQMFGSPLTDVCTLLKIYLRRMPTVHHSVFSLSWTVLRLDMFVRRQLNNSDEDYKTNGSKKWKPKALMIKDLAYSKNFLFCNASMHQDYTCCHIRMSPFGKRMIRMSGGVTSIKYCCISNCFNQWQMYKMRLERRN